MWLTVTRHPRSGDAGAEERPLAGAEERVLAGAEERALAGAILMSIRRNY